MSRRSQAIMQGVTSSPAQPPVCIHCSTGGSCSQAPGCITYCTALIELELVSGLVRVCAALAARPPPSWYFLSLSGQQQAARQPHRQDTAHSSTLAPAPPVSSLTPVTGSQPLQVVTCHPLSWPRAGHTGQAQLSPASSSQHGTAACCCSLLTASLPPWPPPAPCSW